MPRRKKPYVEGHYQKHSYRTRDNTKLKITNYLYSKGEVGAIRNDIISNTSLPVQQWTNFDGILNELVEWEWITKSPVSSKIYLCKITQNGRKVIEKIRQIIDEKHPIKYLDAFDEIDQL